ncbi:ATPase and permease component of ABC-type transporter involved in cytochrome bd biosynthesis [Desulfosporosinus acidiphilus SJ4]|uniref:ATPase and permease component of ABC-type transporter involved in cytochrome bd biosynthesis n=1 Tax=Desulfosporosinus acidiphilus (strain DSM 22704 / JCM 16185 / SJ4) TaxID=646529 RepID=I4D4Y9_DESAJ|nr:ATP-binding cassette domain-containing protein [Desulfosporosinus acidiphilus]AFM40863.1 ATPase and permease component of ABC-type transporter involved in cytochrome bd biosynthesis [Desulfosporosinus acidiphilus SJ4]
MFEFLNVKYKDVLDLPTLNIGQEKITTFIGPSGSGKTTILKMLNKLISPTQGKIIFKETDLQQINSVAHRRQVSMLSQNPAIFAGSIRDNLNAGLKFQERELPSDGVLNHILEQVKLNKSLESAANTLSGGEKQRLALGRLLLLNSEVYLLDEPSSALDDETEEIIIQMLTDHIKREKKTIVMVTHSKAIAQKYSDIIIEISKGKMLKSEVQL